MAENSKIEWCDATFNPWLGCTKVSNGCQHCYAEALMDKRWGKVEWGPQGQRKRTSKANWRKPYQWNKKAASEGRRYRVFCASLADVFEHKPDQPEMDEWRADLFSMIAATPRLDWLLLTKRPELVNQTIERVTGFSDAEMWFHSAGNVWIGTSVEDQAAADKRIPELLKVPAKVRFLSCEPLLGPVTLTSWDQYIYPDGFENNGPMQAILGLSYEPDNLIDWVIVGGESGPKARPMHPDWARSLRDQCVEAGVPYFFKQWGEFCPGSQLKHLPKSVKEQVYASRKESVWMHVTEGFNKEYHPPKGFIPNAWEDGWDLMTKVGKKAAGRLLDGRTWDQFPAVP